MMTHKDNLYGFGYSPLAKQDNLLNALVLKGFTKEFQMAIGEAWRARYRNLNN